MRSNSVLSLVLASIFVVASAGSASAQATYAVVTPAKTTYTIVAEPKAATTNSATPAHKAPTHELIHPEVTSLVSTSEKPTIQSYQAMFRADAFEVLNQTLAIQARTTDPTMTADEFALFQAIHTGRAANYSLAEVSLIVSGVHDPARRQQYLAKIDQIVAAAQKEADRETTIKDKAQAIIKYLLTGPLKPGFESNQYD